MGVVQHASLRRYDQRVEINEHCSIGLFVVVVVVMLGIVFDYKLEFAIV